MDLHALGGRVTRPRWVVATGALALLVAVWAAATPGAVKIFTNPGYRPVKQNGYDDTPNWVAGEYLGENTGASQGGSDLEGALGYVVVGFLGLLIAFCVFMVVRQLVQRSTRPAVAEADASVDLDLEELARAVATGADDRLAALSAGTPAEGVVAAWTHLEAAVHAAGVALPVSRTSTEVTLEVLRHFRVDDATLRGLAELYREARWSTHALDEDDRARAGTAFRALDAAVREATPTPGGRPRG